MNGIDPGRLRDEVIFQRYVEKQNELNLDSLELEEFKTVRAEVKPMRGYEYLEYYREKNKVQVKITCRYFQGLTEDMVAVVDDKVYEIQNIIDVENRHRILEVMVVERVGEEK